MKLCQCSFYSAIALLASVSCTSSESLSNDGNSIREGDGAAGDGDGDGAAGDGDGDDALGDGGNSGIIGEGDSGGTPGDGGDSGKASDNSGGSPGGGSGGSGVGGSLWDDSAIVTTLGPCIDSSSSSTGDSRTSTTNGYDAEGRLVLSVVDQDADMDGSVDYQTVTTYSYDSEGIVVLTVIERRDFLEGTIQSRQRIEFDPILRIETSRLDRNGDGADDYGWLQQYDEAGNLLLYEVDEELDGLADFQRVVTYDDRGNELSATSFASGILGRSETQTWDAQDSLLTMESDNDGDGSIDYRIDNQFTYDEDGRQLTAYHSQDNDADGETDSYSEHSWSYDESGYTITSERASTGNGIDSISYTVFDLMGNQTSLQVDDGADGSIDFDETSSYNEAGQILNRSWERSSGETGSLTYSYDKEGQAISYTQEERTSDGTSTTSSATWTYDCQP